MTVPQYPEAVFWLALVAVVVPTVVSGVLTAVNGWDRSITISRHVAMRRTTIMVFALTETTANAVLALYIWQVLYGQARLWLVTCLLITAIQALVVVAAWVPHTTSGRVRIHRWSAWRAVEGCFILSFLMVVQAVLHGAVWLIVATAIYAAFMATLLALYRSAWLARNLLYAEFGVFIGFGVAVLAFGLA